MTPEHAGCTLDLPGTMQYAGCCHGRTYTCAGTISAAAPARMNLAALKWAAMADNLPVFAVSLAMPLRRRGRARFAGVVAGVVLGFVVGVALGFALAAGVHAGPHSLVATVPLVLVLVLASALGSLSLRAISA